MHPITIHGQGGWKLGAMDSASCGAAGFGIPRSRRDIRVSWAMLVIGLMSCVRNKHGYRVWRNPKGVVFDGDTLSMAPARLFNFTPPTLVARRRGYTTGDLRSALAQVDLWKSVIRKDQAAFIRDKLEEATRLPTYTRRGRSSSFRTRSPKDLRQGWMAFGGYDYPQVNYLIVCGRWSALNDLEKGWFLSRANDERHRVSIRTFEQLARDAFTGLYVNPSH